MNSILMIKSLGQNGNHLILRFTGNMQMGPFANSEDLAEIHRMKHFISVCIICFNKTNLHLNLYKPSIQTVQIQIRHHIMQLKFEKKNENKYTIQHSYNWKWTGPIDRSGKFRSA